MFSQYNLGLVFHTIYSGIFHPCYLLLHFPPLQFCPYRIFYSRIFSRAIGIYCFISGDLGTRLERKINNFQR